MTEKIIILLAMIAFDIITGWVKAISRGEYNSARMREGMWHKLAEILAAGFCLFCDYALPRVGCILPVALFNCVLVYIVIMEITSIVENLGQTYPELGKYLSTVFEKVERPERTIKNDN